MHCALIYDAFFRIEWTVNWEHVLRVNPAQSGRIEERGAYMIHVTAEASR